MVEGDSKGKEGPATKNGLTLNLIVNTINITVSTLLYSTSLL